MIRLHDYCFVVVNSINEVKEHELPSAWNMKNVKWKKASVLHLIKYSTNKKLYRN